jgi:hypothetical protein
MAPLETIARMCTQLEIERTTTSKTFDNYDRFLGILDNAEKRAELTAARTHDDLRLSKAWREVREVSEPFH